MRLNVRALPVNQAPIHESGARQTFAPAKELERLVSCALLGERQFYVGSDDIEARIRALAATVPCEEVASAAVRARADLGLRHVPLLLLVCLAARRECGPLVRATAGVVLRTPKDAMDLIALYWSDGKKPLPASFKRAIVDGFAHWTEYQIAKYATLTNVAVRLRDLLFLAHVKPIIGQDALFKSLADQTLRAPDTWEAGLSVPGADKRAVWERLLSEGKLGALALVRNLRNMEQVGVEPALVRAAMLKAKAADVWPWQALAAAREAPAYTHDLDALMLRSVGQMPRIVGKTVVLVDVSGSMNEVLSVRGTMKRMDAAAGLAVLLREVCAESVIASFSDQCVALNQPPRGAHLAHAIVHSQPNSGTHLGAAVRGVVEHVPDMDRLIVLTDEQSQDRVTYPEKPAFVVNLASTQRGINWEGPVTRLNGWSGGVVRWLAQEIAGASVGGEEEE